MAAERSVHYKTIVKLVGCTCLNIFGCVGQLSVIFACVNGWYVSSVFNEWTDRFGVDLNFVTEMVNRAYLTTFCCKVAQNRRYITRSALWQKSLPHELLFSMQFNLKA